MNVPIINGPKSVERVRKTMRAVVVRFAGDSGDGIQTAGDRFGLESAFAGNDMATFPDFPSEIRAPVGTTYGVSTFQVQFSSDPIHTAGDALDALVALNPAALKTNLSDLKKSGVLIVDTGTFSARACEKVGFVTNPLEDKSLDAYQIFKIDISNLVREVVAALPDVDITSKKDALKARNMWALGLILWLYGRDKQATSAWIAEKFKKLPDVAVVNEAALKAGYDFAITIELPSDLEPVEVPPATLPAGHYRSITGTHGIVYGLAAGALRHGLDALYCSYPITPASAMLHGLIKLGEGAGIRSFQAEDEIAAICAAIGASYGGAIGITGTSGPGMALKGEALGLAVATELPLVVINVQRGGPSTGLPTKTEQSDLFQAVMGRNADTPIPVIAAARPSDAFEVAIEAIRLAVKYMTPVIVLSDGYIANASEPWTIPDLERIEPLPIVNNHAGDDFQPFARDEATLARAWVVPGTRETLYRIGGLEKQDGTGNVSYDPDNHQRMTNLRRQKIEGIAADIPEQDVHLGDMGGDVAVVGWGSTFGSIHDAVGRLRDRGLNVSHIHIRHIMPFPQNLGTLLSTYKRVIVPEMNMGQMVDLIRAKYLIDARPLSKVSGRPFTVEEIEQAVEAALQEINI